MKNILLMLPFFFAVISTQAKEKAEQIQFKVNGNCDMCKARIEKAATVNGVKSAEWNEQTHFIIVKFMPSKTNKTAIQQHIAAAGYDTEDVTASDDAYQALPQCCQYTR